MRLSNGYKKRGGEKMIKKWSVIGIIFICCLLFCGKSNFVNAAEKFVSAPLNHVDKEVEVGKTKIYLKATGSFFSGLTSEKIYVVKGKKRILLASADGKKTKLVGGVLTDGNTVYYTKTFYTISLGGRTKVPKKCCIYKVKIGGNNKSQKICTINSRSSNRRNLLELPNILGVWKNKIFYYEGNTVYCYFMASKKHEEIAYLTPGKSGKQFKNHIYYMRYGWGEFGLYEINAKTGKVTTISKHVMINSREKDFRYDIIDGKIYYLELLDQEPLHKASYNSYGRYYDHVALKRCKLDGSGEETLIGDFAVAYAKTVVFKKNSITYYNEQGKKRTRKFS
jgi:hypothetical protein